jgi:hypothetical protein
MKKQSLTSNKKQFLLLIILALFMLIGCKKESETDTTLTGPADTTGVSDPVLPADHIGEQENDSIYKDSLFNDQLQDFAKDLSQDLLENLLEKMLEEAENGDWKQANRWYEKTAETIKEKGWKGKNLLQQNEPKMAAAKSYIISMDPNKNDLPDSEVIPGDQVEKGFATDKIENGTQYTLTLYYNGPTTKIIDILPGQSVKIRLGKGAYSIVAKVNDTSVKEFYGTQIYKGFDYSCRFYIRTGL